MLDILMWVVIIYGIGYSLCWAMLMRLYGPGELMPKIGTCSLFALIWPYWMYELLLDEFKRRTR
jgi:hypothetical protein